MSKALNCPACGAKGIATTAVRAKMLGLADPEPIGPCGQCGWCVHMIDTTLPKDMVQRCQMCNRLAVPRKKWCEPDHLPRPRDMSAEEFAFRAGLFVVWKTRPASELASQFLIFADWLADRGSAEDLAARADWKPYASKRHDPKGWYQWSVPAGEGWVSIEPIPQSEWTGNDWLRNAPPPPAINYDRARLTKSLHNGRWLLCWPPGFVRFTAPLSHDPQRWRATVEANRLNGSTPSRPVERVWPGGYSQLIASYAAPVLDVREGLVRERVEDLGLFADVEESA